MKYWLFKSEPGAYSFTDLLRDKVAEWDGVRNYQARNFMRDEMKAGDEVLFYHSSTEEPAIVGIARIVKEAYPDHTAFDPNDKHYDPKSKRDNPTWLMVDLAPALELKQSVTLKALKANPRLESMLVTRRGMRLSIQPVTPEEWAEVLAMAGGEANLTAEARAGGG